MHLEDQHQLILRYLQHTDAPVFLTGKAGTGKTTFMQYIRFNVGKQIVVVAPTAVAAINASGATMHSFFQIPFGPLLPKTENPEIHQSALRAGNKEKDKILRGLELLIIDEISMVRADVLDYIDQLLRQVRVSSRPFGGVQLLMVGDPYQLPPIADKDWSILGKFYKSPYFFDSQVLQESGFLTFELTRVHRQKDASFVEILNQIRHGSIQQHTLDKLNTRCVMSADQDLSDYTTLSTHNKTVDQINQKRLQDLDGLPHAFNASISGEFPIDAYPVEKQIVLKEGAHVMFTKNDNSGNKLYYNGRTARVSRIDNGKVHVEFFDDGSEFVATNETWQNVKYAFSEADGKINESSTGSFSQLPLRLAWAVTIHKSQGLTFAKAAVDVHSAFAPGQVYVALSRCQTLEGLVLTQPVSTQNVIIAPEVRVFMQKVSANTYTATDLERSKHECMAAAIHDLFDFSNLSQCWLLARSRCQTSHLITDILRPGLDHIASILQTMVKVSNSFKNKDLLQALSADNEHRLSDRLRKATDYFSEQLLILGTATEEFQQKFDTHLTGKDFSIVAGQFRVFLEIKNAMFLLMKEANTLQELAATPNRVLAQYRQQATESKLTKAKRGVEIANPELYEILLEWRQKIAHDRGVQEYIIVSDTVLRQVAQKVPETLTALSQVKNFGQVKATDFGSEIIRLIAAYKGTGQLFG